jgi:glutaminyl-tRNA synthetase
VFNRIVTLKDAWARMNEKPPQEAASKAASKPQPEQKPVASGTPKGAKPEMRELTPEQEALSKRYGTELGVGSEEASLLASDVSLSRFFEDALSAHNNPQGIANWIVNELMRELKERPLESLPFGPKELAELVALLDDETISGKIAKDVYAEMLKSGGSPRAIVEAKGLKQISDPAELEPVIDRIMAAHPDNVAKYKEGRSSLFGFFVGQVLKDTGGRANPRLVNELLEFRLK